MNAHEFERIVEQALEQLPERFRVALKNVAIVIEDEPTPYDLHRSHVPRGSTLFGLYQGIPPAERATRGQPYLPDKITIYRGPLTRHFHDEKGLEEQITVTVWHELGHYFGLPESKLPKLERRWRSRRRSG